MPARARKVCLPSALAGRPRAAPMPRSAYADASLLAGRPKSLDFATPRSTRATHAPEVGLGMEITERKPHRVISLSKDGAALACGQIKDGDILMAIEDRKVDRLPMKEIKLLLQDYWHMQHLVVQS